MFSALRRSILTQAEWKVLAQISLACSPSIRSRRSFSSPAALLVKVMASISHGFAGDTLSSGSMSNSSSALTSPFAAARMRLSSFSDGSYAASLL